MNELTAKSMIRALKPFRQYLLINEWENIRNVIMHWVEDKKTETKEENKYLERQEEPPLKALFNKLWEKKITLPIGVNILIFVTGLLIGVYGF